MIAKLAAALSAFALSMTSIAAEWERIAPLPEPNGGFIASADSGGITVLGGTNWADGTKHWLRNISHYRPEKNRWEVIARLGEPVAYALPGIVRNADGRQVGFVMLGGSNGIRPLKCLAVVDTIKTALQPAPALPEKIALCAGGIVGDTFIIVGGTDNAANNAGFTNRAFSFDLTKRTLAPLPDFPGRPFGNAAYATIRDDLFVFGGANWDETQQAVANTAVAHAFSVAGKQWRGLKPYPFAVRGLGGVNLDDRHIYLAGGYKNDAEEFTAEAFIYDVNSGEYAAASPLPLKAAAHLVKLEDWIYCIGGEDRKAHRTDAVFRIEWKELLRLN